MKHSPYGVFLCERKAMLIKLMRIGNKLGFDKMEVVEAEGWKGGTTFMWNRRHFLHF